MGTICNLSAINNHKLLRIVVLLMFMCYASYVTNPNIRHSSKNRTEKVSNRRFAVFSCSTPNSHSHRGYDYAFYLPLTVLAWQRIGYESVVLIIGDEKEWQRHPLLAYVLKALTDLTARMSSSVRVIFIPTDENNRLMLSQTSRLFVTNMADFPGRSTDYVMTTDADLWPLRREHFYQPVGVINRPLTLIHSDCCDPCQFKGRTYRMIPMSHIGASASTWRQLINVYPSLLANDSSTILKYCKRVFGRRVYNPVEYASSDWYIDQKLISIRVDQWIRKKANSSTGNLTFEPSDDGFYRIDRDEWRPDLIPMSEFSTCFDVHLIRNGFLPVNWKTIQMILNYMYDSRTRDWCDTYAKEFHNIYTWI